MRLAIVVAALTIAAGPAASNECGVFTDPAHEPGKITAELKPNQLIIRSAPDFEYEWDLDTVAPGENFQWGRTDTDVIGRAKVRQDGQNLILEIADGPELSEDAADPQEQPEHFSKAVYVPFCPGA